MKSASTIVRLILSIRPEVTAKLAAMSSEELKATYKARVAEIDREKFQEDPSIPTALKVAKESAPEEVQPFLDDAVRLWQERNRREVRKRETQAKWDRITYQVHWLRMQGCTVDDALDVVSEEEGIIYPSVEREYYRPERDAIKRRLEEKMARLKEMAGDSPLWAEVFPNVPLKNK